MNSLQVTEAADSSAWKLWKDSVAMIESQLSALPRHKVRRRTHDEAPTEPRPETFARVKKP